ncbi:hypothetical protein ABR28_10250 [Enterobacter hormaechei subsp. hoffmannii]|uniref:hypothetical protein n=1 Tax=Enterobacter hormaechei TaxID=158836 RepID=UPI0006437E54|nr:hypothetical protein [Enterobacter hormaechei]KLR24038.1 hypothetical protein ABR28_10250 [Enterobacter hormaechei subsp. hoffmannii]
MTNISCFKIPGVSSSSLGRQSLIQRIGYYGFIECASMINFLQYICDDQPGIPELHYLLHKTRECLRTHDNQDDYFAELRQLCQDISAEIIRLTRE